MRGPESPGPQSSAPSRCDFSEELSVQVRRPQGNRERKSIGLAKKLVQVFP